MNTYSKVACCVAACAIGKVRTDSADSTDIQVQTLSQAALQLPVLCCPNRPGLGQQCKISCAVLYSYMQDTGITAASIRLYVIVSILLVISGANDLQQLRHQSCRYHFILREAWQYQLQQSLVALFANIARLT